MNKSSARRLRYSRPRKKQPITFTLPMPPASEAAIGLWQAEVCHLAGGRSMPGAIKVMAKLGFAAGRVAHTGQIMQDISEALEIAGVCEAEAIAAFDIRWSRHQQPGEVELTIAGLMPADSKRSNAGNKAVSKAMLKRWADTKAAVAKGMEARP